MKITTEWTLGPWEFGDKELARRWVCGARVALAILMTVDTNQDGKRLYHWELRAPGGEGLTFRYAEHDIPRPGAQQAGDLETALNLSMHHLEAALGMA